MGTRPRESLDQGNGYACLGRGARTWRDDNPFWSERLNLVQRDLVVAHDRNGGTELAEILVEIISERIVVIDQENHRTPSDPFGNMPVCCREYSVTSIDSASSIARRRARILW